MSSNPVRLKICGMRDEANIAEVAALKPDYMGFIFYDKSPRAVGIEIPRSPDRAIIKVGVFVNASEESIVNTAQRNGISMVQLHGDESPAFCEAMKQQGLQVIKAFRIDTAFDFKTTSSFESVADYFLFDTKGEKFGGNAVRFDWRLLGKYNQRIPFFLSGGLNPENLDELSVVLGMNLHALDLNSGVEQSPGYKNISKVQQVVSKLHKINQHGIPGR